MATARMRRSEPDVDSIGFLKKRAIRLRELGVVAVGKLVPRPAKPEATKADEVMEARAFAAVRRAHRDTVAREITIIDERIEEIDKRIAATGPGVNTPELAEARAERRMLRELRADLVSEQESPIMIDRDGRRVDDSTRKMIAGRARWRAEQNWEAAERAAAAGDHREARVRRVNAYRGRHLAEYEAGLRPSLAGFTSPWA